MSLTSLAWRSLRARPLRSLLSGLGVALGVAVLFAGLVTNAGIEASVNRTVADVIGRADLRVAAFGKRGLSAETVATITGTPGVELMAPAIERRVYLEPDLEAGQPLSAPVTVLGIDPVAEPRLHDFRLVAGSMLREQTELSALISDVLATEDHLTVGAPITIQGAGDRATYRVIGILAGEGPLTGAFGRTVVVPLQTAQTVFGATAPTRIDIAVPAGADGAVAADLESRLVTQPYVLSTPGDIAASLRSSTADFEATTALIAAIALFAGAFLIFNTLSMTVVEQVRDVGLLRAAGATRRQVTTFMLSQALVLGALGSLVGIGLGAILAEVMVIYSGTIGLVTLGPPPLPLDVLLIVIVVGIGVTLAAALEPARRAGRIEPVEALKSRVELPFARQARLRWLMGVFALVAVVGLIAAPRGAGVARALAIYAILLLGTLCIPIILPAVARLAGLPFSVFLRLEERLARSSVVHDPSRATMTLGALTIGLALIVALGGVGQHARAAAGAWIADVVPGELILTSIRPIAVDEGVEAEVHAAVPSIARISRIATFEIALDGSRTDAAAVVGADLAADGRLHFTSGDRAEALSAIDTGGATIMPAGLADRLGIAVGDVLTVPDANAEALDLRVVGIVERSIPGTGGEAMLVGWTDASSLGVDGADVFGIRFTADAPASARDDLRAVATRLALDDVSLDRIKGTIDDALGRIFRLFDALAVVAVLIAALGIVNTLTMNVMERVREIGILRTAGMTRGQVWRLVVVEAGILGLAGAILGVVLGLVVGGLMVVLAGGQLDIATDIPWQIVGFSVLLGVAVAMLAAAYPARYASRTPIIRAVQRES